MAKIIIIGPSHISRTPRLVRNANALADAGHDVAVFTPVYDSKQIEEDNKIVSKSRWTYKGISCLNKKNAITASDRLFRKLFFIIAKKTSISRIGSLGYVYGYTKILQHANLNADFFLAQQQSTLPLVAKIAESHKKPYGCDIEDILSESKDEPKKLFCSIEKKYFKTAKILLTMSQAASDFLFNKYKGIKPPTVLHNTPSLDERKGKEKEFKIKIEKRPSIYWFGQTLGPHSCALELLKANIGLGSPFEIFLRGRPIDSYVNDLISTSKKTQKQNDLNILPVLSPDDMVVDCMKYDVLFGSQPSNEYFHQLAIGNKVFTGLSAGTALLLEDTIAHRQLTPEIEDCCVIVPYKNESLLKTKLRNMAKDRNYLIRMQKKSWEYGTRKFNWENESKKLVTAIEQIVK